MSLSRRKSLPLHASTASRCWPSLPLPPTRCGSFGSRRLRLSSSINTTIWPERTSIYAPKVPIELLENIIESYADIVLNNNAPILLRSQKFSFKRFFVPCTLVSKAFRQLSMKAFFRSLVFNSTQESSGLLTFLALLDEQYAAKQDYGGYSWVRHVSSPSFLIVPNVKAFEHLIYLEGLHIDFAHSGVSLLRSGLKRIFGSLATYRSIANLTSLKLTELPRIDEVMLHLVARNLPNLVHARFVTIDSLDMECCPNCYEDSLSRVNHSPVSEIYGDVTVLAVSHTFDRFRRIYATASVPSYLHGTLKDTFGRALGPLTKLESVFFGVFLSPSFLLDFHVNHEWNETELSSMTMETVYNCTRCIRYEKSTKRHELLASLLVAHHVPSLRTVGWGSVFGKSCNPANDDADKGKQAEDDNVDSLQGCGDHDSDLRTHRSLSVYPSLSSIQRKKPSSAAKVCPCNGHGLETSLAIFRTCDKIRVERVLGVL